MIGHLTDQELDDQVRSYLEFRAERAAARAAAVSDVSVAIAQRVGLIRPVRSRNAQLVRLAVALLLVLLALLGAAVVGGLLRDPYTPDQPLIEVPLDGSPWGVVGAYNFMWVTSADGRVLYRVDPRDGHVVNDIQLTTHMCGTARAGFDALWISHCEETTISRINARTLEVAKVIGYDTDQIGISNDSVWVSTLEGSVVRLDPQTLDEEAAIDVGGGSLLEFGDGAIWATIPDLALVRRIDPATNSVVATIALAAIDEDGVNPVHSVFGGGALWVVDEPEGQLYRVDPVTNSARPVGVTIESFEGQFGDWYITYGRGRVWVRTASDTITAIDPATLQVDRTITTPIGAGGGFFVADGSIWLGNNLSGTIWGMQLR
ncbi:MAG: glutaminyl-peptide cyclotransferase [Candidatus Limnocylindrales bacterium]